MILDPLKLTVTVNHNPFQWGYHCHPLLATKTLKTGNLKSPAMGQGDEFMGKVLATQA